MSKLSFKVIITFIIILNLSYVYNMVSSKLKKDNLVNKEKPFFTNLYNKVESFKANVNSTAPFKKINKIIKNHQERIELFNHQKQNTIFENTVKTNQINKFQKVENLKTNKNILTKNISLIEIK